MRVLVYRYNSICEPDVITTFEEFGFEVTEYRLEMVQKDLALPELVKSVDLFLQDHPVDFIFSINFFPMLSEICNIYHMRYVSWVVDSPVMELFSTSIANPWNRTFVFDRAIYHEIAPLNPACIFHLPLAARVQEKERLFEKTTEEERKRFSHRISFVGSLYSEKNPYDKVRNLPEKLRGYFDAIMSAQQKVYGEFFLEELLSDEQVEAFCNCHPSFYRYPGDSYLTDRMTLAQLYMGNKITAMERETTFRILSEHFPVDIYTGSDTSKLPAIHNCGRAKTLTEMPLIFHYSKININTTSKAIRSGLPLRIFDILSCGGFVLTNYQPEIEACFVPGEDMAVYGSLEEMVYLAKYYLSHDKQRIEIAACGYESLKRNYTYEIQMGKMMLMAFDKEEQGI